MIYIPLGKKKTKNFIILKGSITVRLVRAINQSFQYKNKIKQELQEGS